MVLVSVAEAAEELGVSERRVRQMLDDGSLTGRRIGRSWVIDLAEVHRRGRRPAPKGRPWSPRSAWALLAVLDGEPSALSPTERSRARRRVRGGIEPLVDRLRARADERSFYAHPGVLSRLAAEPEIVRGGVSALVDHGLDLVVESEFDGYVRGRDLDAVVSRFALDGEAERPNVLLRVVSDDCWPFAPDQRVAGRAVVAADLLDSDDTRTARAGSDLAATL